ncbi:hypothetical protein ALC53_08907 [Atta colombica]|uniref:Uncharacterized protein n=1 Tax=Atta colombica TaxID=520822 RepID=A0A195B880_9HYME|nr:hypothetical protein ALC53_08907 [Atta colombica]
MKRKPHLLALTANDFASVLNILFTEYWHLNSIYAAVASQTRDINRCSVVHRARIYVTHHDETGGPPNCATCAQERNRTRALGARLENAQAKKRERLTKSKKQDCRVHRLAYVLRRRERKRKEKTKIRASWNSARRSSVRHRVTTLDFVRWNPNTGVVQPAPTFVSRLSKHVKTLSIRVMVD